MAQTTQHRPSGPIPAASRLAVRGARVLYTAVDDSPFSGVLQTRAVRWCKSRVTRMPASDACWVLAALTEAGCRTWVAGGWGIDALLGRQTRTHYDLDVVIEASDGVEARAKAALIARGFRTDRDELNPGLAMPQRWIMDDDLGHIVDLLPVDLTAWPFSSLSPDGVFARGRIGDRKVDCLSAALQVALHQGYVPREADSVDIRALCEQADLPVPAEFA